MADIIMCTSENCEMRDKCYRAQAKTTIFQCWSNLEYACNENNNFKDFIKMPVSCGE